MWTTSLVLMVLCVALYTLTNEANEGEESSLLNCPDLYEESEDFTDYARRMWTGVWCLSVWWLPLVTVSRYHRLRYTLSWSSLLPSLMTMLRRLLLMELPRSFSRRTWSSSRRSLDVFNGQAVWRTRGSVAWWYWMWGTLSYWANTPTDRSSVADTEVQRCHLHMIWWSTCCGPRPSLASQRTSTSSSQPLLKLDWPRSIFKLGHSQVNIHPQLYPSSVWQAFIRVFAVCSRPGTIQGVGVSKQASLHKET